MPVLAVLNQKGGVGKTTVAVNLAYTYAQRGGRVLVGDVDKQAAATSTLVAAELPLTAPTLADVLQADPTRAAQTLRDSIVTADPHWGSVDLLPSSLDLEDVWTSRAGANPFRLRSVLDEASVHDMYDWVILDGPPDLGGGTLSAVTAADLVLIVTAPERMSLHGVARTVETVNVVRRDMRPDVQLAGIVMVAVKAGLTEHRVRVDEARRLYGDLVLTSIPHRLLADQASGAGHAGALLAGDAGTAFAEVYGDLADHLTTIKNGISA